SPVANSSRGAGVGRSAWKRRGAGPPCAGALPQRARDYDRGTGIRRRPRAMDREPQHRNVPRWRDSLRTRASLWSALLSVVLVAATTLAFYVGARMLAVQNARIEARALTRQGALNVEAILESVQVSGR